MRPRSRRRRACRRGFLHATDAGRRRLRAVLGTSGTAEPSISQRSRFIGLRVGLGGHSARATFTLTPGRTGAGRSGRGPDYVEERVAAGRQQAGRENGVGLRTLELAHRFERRLLSAEFELLSRLGDPRAEDRVEQAAVANLPLDEPLEAVDREHGFIGQRPGRAAARGGTDECAERLGPRHEEKRRDRIGCAEGLEDPAGKDLVEAKGRGEGDGPRPCSGDRVEQGIKGSGQCRTDGDDLGFEFWPCEERRVIGELVNPSIDRNLPLLMGGLWHWIRWC